MEYQGIILGNIFLKVYKSKYDQKDNFISFSLFLFHKNIPNTFEVIELLLKTNIIFSNFLVNFCLV